MPEDNIKKDNKLDLNVNISYVDESNVVNGSINKDSGVGVYQYDNKFIQVSKNNEYNLSEWRNDYKNGMSSDEILDKIKTEIKKDPKILTQYLDTLTEEFYDSDKKPENTGLSAKETLDLFLKTPEGEHIDGFVCMNIHEFGMRLLNDVGIEAAVLTGNTPKSESHATLLYKNGEGNYTYINYDKKFVIEAPTIKDAAREVYKRSGELNSNGYISFVTDKGSYREFALKDEAIWGDEMDKRDYNTSTVFNHDLQKKSSLDIDANISNHLSSEVSLGTTVAYENKNVLHNFSVALGVKNNERETSLADKSTSFGAKMAYEAQIKDTKIGNITFGTKVIGSENILKYENPLMESRNITSDQIVNALKDAGYDNLSAADIKDINEFVQSGNIPRTTGLTKDKINMLSVFTRTYLNSTGTIYKDEKNEVSRSNEINVSMSNSFYSFENEGQKHIDIAGDAQIGTEHGIQAKTNINNTTLNNAVSVGVIGNLRHNGGDQKRTFAAGGKFNLDSGFQSMPKNNVVVGGNVSLFAVPTTSYTDFGANINAYASYKPNNSKVTIFGSANAGYQQQNIHLGINELTERNITCGAKLGVDINNKARVSLSYQQHLDGLNKTRNNSLISLNAKINL